MIHLVLRSPNGDGTYSDALGMTTDNVAHTINGVICLPGIIGSDSVSQMESQIDISQARGNVSQGISWSFDILDWTGSARRSVGILDGGTRFVGWRVAMYLDDAGSATVLDAVGGSADAFQVCDVEANGTRVTLSVVSAWTLRGDTIGLASGESVVGLVAGPYKVSAPTQALPEPEVLYRTDWAGTTFEEVRSGVPGIELGSATVQKSAATRKADIDVPAWSPTGRAFVFMCASEADAIDLYNSVTENWDKCFLIGKEYSENVSRSLPGTFTCGYGPIPGATGSAFGISCSIDFYNSEDAADVHLSISATAAPIAYGVESFSGFSKDGRVFTPVAEITVDSTAGLLTISPASFDGSLGFAAVSAIPYSIGWMAGYRPYGAQVKYYGNLGAIGQEVSGSPTYSGYDAVTLESYATSPGSPAVIWSKFDDNNVPDVTLPLRIVPSNTDVSAFGWFAADLNLRLVVRSLVPGTINLTAPVSVPFTKVEVNPLSVEYAVETIRSFPVSLVDMPSPTRKFASIDDMNATGSFFISNSYANGLTPIYMNAQIESLTLYGGAYLSFGSAYALVQPGASPWWASPLSAPYTAARLLSVVAPSCPPNIPASALGGPLILSGFGQYIAPDDTFTSSAVKLCEEFWTILCPDGADGANGAGAGEKPVAPTFALGAVEDVVTEPVIEYAPVAGSYTGRAYIAHVDEEFDAENASRFYGGWGKGADDSEFPGGDYGYMIWRTCREAYKVHGIRRAATYQFDGVHFAGNVGGYWFEAMRNGARRIEWLAYQPRFVTFKIRENAPPTWWAGNAVTIPTTMAGFAGYDFSAFSTDPVIVVSKVFDPVTMETEYEVALPPVVPE